MKWRSYPEYKDSGVEWPRKVPEHWKIQRIRNIIDMSVSNVDKHTKEGELSVRLCNYIDVYKNDQITEHISFMRATATPEEIERFRLKPDDVLITKDSEAWNDIGIPALVEYTADDLVCGYHLALLRPRKTLIRGPFLLRALQCPEVAFQFHVAANGVTRYGLSHESIKSVLLPVSPITEQTAIAAFLDRKTEKIDGLLAKKVRLIELLQEKRAALISHAVTKGLDPSVPMKDSGVEWLGEVPAHWEVKRLKRLARLRSGLAITSETIEEVGEYPVFGGNGIRGFTSFYTHEGDLPIIGRQGALCGCVNFAHGRFWASEHAVVATPEPEVNPHWLMYLLRAMSLNTYSQSAAQPGLAVETISALQVCMPDITEQRATAAALDSETAKIDTLSSKIQNTIKKLKEYRSALISAAVTGKIDVRQEVA
jgi:type I restriction enzyme S subunit